MRHRVEAAIQLTHGDGFGVDDCDLDLVLLHKALEKVTHNYQGCVCVMNCSTEIGQSHVIANYDECVCVVDCTTELGQSQDVGNCKECVYGGLPY